MRFRRHLIRLLVVLLLLTAGVYSLFRVKFRPVVQNLAVSQVSSVTSDMINDAIAEQIANDNIQYDRIIYFEKDLNGRITALKTNMSEINRLKSCILNILNDEILTLDSSDLGIPLGSLILPELFSGKGPEIPVRILAVRDSEASFFSNFSEAGINQTLHQIIMDVALDVTVLVLGKTERFSVTSQVVVAETIIVGAVPDTFLQPGGLYGSEK
ncbi:MAG: sporulation protein YunB [Faecousia sp.]